MERQRGIRDPMLDAAACPAGAWYLWEYFLRMSARRTGNGYGPNALSSAEVEAWARLNGVRLAPFEAEALDGLEARFLSHYAKEVAAR